jgi:hypothetical protein
LLAVQIKHYKGKQKMKNGYWYFDAYEDDWVYVPSVDELNW